jgi:uncharacterized membrane protein YqjE
VIAPVDSPPPASRSLLGSLRALGDSFLATTRDRAELLSIELREEKYRLVQSFAWICAAAVSALLTAIFGSLAVLYTCVENQRLAVLGLFTFGYAALTAGIVAGFRRHLARQPRPLAATLEELESDQTCIRKEN